MEAFLTLTEPDPLRDVDAWTAWFDNLRNCSDFMAEQVQETGAKMPTALADAPKWANRKY